MRKDTDTYKISDGILIEADVYRPDGESTRSAIVWIHGGALIVGRRTSIPPVQLEAYINAGYAVIATDYRLAPETKLPAIVEDVEDALTWVREVATSQYELNAERLAVVGHSAGGYLALSAGARGRPRPAAVVAFYGYGDIVGTWYGQPDPFYLQRPRVAEADAYSNVGGEAIAGSDGIESEKRFLFYLYCRQQGLWPRLVSGQDPASNPRWFDPWCPIRNVSSEYPPTLLLHGDHDTDVPYEQSVLMATELERAGVPHELVTIPGGEHGFDRAVGGADPVVNAAFDQVLAFLKSYLG